MVRGFAGIRLEVVDENPDARRLYEREGFVAGRRWSLPAGRRWLGFAGSTVMRWHAPGVPWTVRDASRC
jgi:ribosomal protein S18 acetylase RimI-like enzyme